MRTLDEALDQQGSLEQQKISAKQRVRDLKYQQYTCPFSGSPEQQSERKKEHRAFLLGQISEKEQEKKMSEEERRKECFTTLHADLNFLSQNQATARTHDQYLTQFRDGNKLLIEARERQQRQQKLEQQRADRELLYFDPINWSKTLV